jgi:hypothetical protein
MRPGSSLLLLAITPAVGAVGPCVKLVGTAYRQVDPPAQRDRHRRGEPKWLDSRNSARDVA